MTFLPWSAGSIRVISVAVRSAKACGRHCLFSRAALAGWLGVGSRRGELATFAEHFSGGLFPVGLARGRERITKRYTEQPPALARAGALGLSNVGLSAGAHRRAAVGELVVRPDVIVRAAMSKRKKLFLSLAVFSVLFVVILYVSGFVRPFRITGGSMTPAIAVGDRIIMESFTFWARRPQRGDIVMIRAENMPPLQNGLLLPKRIVGLPGEHLRISEGKLYVNDLPQILRNKAGSIQYVSLPSSRYLVSGTDGVTVPDGHYFVLGDNSANSVDSRSWGVLSANCVVGRVCLCYWPSRSIGIVR